MTLGSEGSAGEDMVIVRTLEAHVRDHRWYLYSVFTCERAISGRPRDSCMFA